MFTVTSVFESLLEEHNLAPAMRLQDREESGDNLQDLSKDAICIAYDVISQPSFSFFPSSPSKFWNINHVGTAYFFSFGRETIINGHHSLNAVVTRVLTGKLFKPKLEYEQHRPYHFFRRLQTVQKFYSTEKGKTSLARSSVTAH